MTDSLNLNQSQSRLEAEKIENQGKISELGVLKSRLNTLKHPLHIAGRGFVRARSVGISPSSSKGFSANAEAGALTGEFEVRVESWLPALK